MTITLSNGAVLPDCDLSEVYRKWEDEANPVFEKRLIVHIPKRKSEGYYNHVLTSEAFQEFTADGKTYTDYVGIAKRVKNGKTYSVILVTHW